MLTVKGRDDKEYRCLSTDTKPKAAANGAILVEIDTFKVYAFDESTRTWLELTAKPDDD